MARDKGDGSLYKDSRGLWTARIELPRAPDGARRQKTVRAKDKATATQKLRDLRRELDQHGDVITKSPTVTDYLTHWITHTAPSRVRPRTVDAYRASIDRWIIPAIGRVKVRDLTPRHIEQVHKLCRTGYGEGKHARKPLSSTTTLHVHRVLAVALRDAVRAGHLRTNPASKDHIEAPRKAATSTDVLTAEQAWTVLRHVATDPLCARWSIALLTGLRQSEALGLERSAIEDGRLIVQWQLQRLKNPPPDHLLARDLGGGYYLTPPKTMGGMRVIPLVSPLKEVLERHIETMLPATSEHDLLFRTERGRPIHASADSKRWGEILEAAGVPRVRLHDARHTVATLLLSAGIDGHVVQSIMGHSSIAMTRHYQHTDLTMATDAMERMTKLLTP